MNEMFSSSKNLISVDISNLNAENLKDISSMFKNCYLLKDINVSNFKTKEVNNMASMFEGCRSLIELNLENLDITKVTDISFMFSHSGIKSIKFWKMNSNRINNMESLFYYCNF